MHLSNIVATIRILPVCNTEILYYECSTYDAKSVSC